MKPQTAELHMPSTDSPTSKRPEGHVLAPANGYISEAHLKAGCGEAAANFPPVLDACCGSRMFWFDRADKNAVFVDKRSEEHTLCDGRKLEVRPDVIADFTSLPFPDETFYLIVFDPPHMTSLGENAWLAKKYGRLLGDWRDEIREGFSECWRVLRPHGTLVFKWNSTDVALADVLELAPAKPMFGHTTGRQAKTHWLCFHKGAVAPAPQKYNAAICREGGQP